MTPTALSIISTTFPEGSERNKALGIWGALGGIGATAAWLIGGPLVDGPGWEWIFFINIPSAWPRSRFAPAPAREPGVPDAAKLRPRRGADDHRRARPARLRARRGAGRRLGRPSDHPPPRRLGRAPCRLRAGRVAPPAPLVPLRLLRSRTLVGANAVMFLVAAVAVGMPFVLTLYAQQVLGYSAVKFGVSSVVLAVAVASAPSSLRPRSSSSASGRRRHRHGADGRGSLLLTQVSVSGSYLETSSSGCSFQVPGSASPS